ncbi:MAG TPA: hypothetical protein VM120_20220 [Bryobacteraceae bacterium]|nr:hypothetical protein [Bryobacteraceae bacterium]
MRAMHTLTISAKVRSAFRLATVPGAARYALLLLLPIPGAGDIQTTAQTLSATISPAGKLSVPAGMTLSGSNTRFGSFAGEMLVSYWARTQGGGGGSVTVQATSEFAPAGGPIVATVTYSCAGATLGTGCSGSQTLQTGSQTSVLSLPGGVCTGGGGACSAQDPNTVQLQFSAPNKPQYKTGTYSAQITFTISTV